MLLILTAMVAISAVTLAGSAFAKKYEKPDALIALYVVFVALSQITATKIAEYDFGVFTVTAPAAVLIFAVTFLITDIVNEKFGRATVHYMIFITFMTQVVMLGFLYICGEMKPAAFWQHQGAWDSLFGVVPRITFASWVTFLISENLDAYLFSLMRKLTKGRHLWARNVFSSGIAIAVDTLVFCTLAFAGTDLPLMSIILGQFAAKYAVCLIDIPFMYLNRSILGSPVEGSGYEDEIEK